MEERKKNFSVIESYPSDCLPLTRLERADDWGREGNIKLFAAVLGLLGTGNLAVAAAAVHLSPITRQE